MDCDIHRYIFYVMDCDIHRYIFYIIDKNLYNYVIKYIFFYLGFNKAISSQVYLSKLKFYVGFARLAYKFYS